LSTILIVDDHAAIRTAVRDLFESRFESVECGEAENGAEAIVKSQKLIEATKRAALEVGIRAVFSKHDDFAPLVTHARAVLQPLGA